MAERTAPHSEIVVGAQDNASPTFDQIRNSVENMARAVEQSSRKAGSAVGQIGEQAEASSRATKNALSALARAQSEVMRSLTDASGYAQKSADGIEYLAKLRNADVAAIQSQVNALRDFESLLSNINATQREAAASAAFDKQHQDAKKLAQASEYVNMWASALDILDAKQREIAALPLFDRDLEAAQQARRRADAAFALTQALDIQEAKERELAALPAFERDRDAAAQARRRADAVAALTQVIEREEAAERKLASQQNFLANLTRETEGIGKTRAELVALQAAQLGVADKAAPLIAKLREQETQFGANGKSAKEMQAALRGVPAQLTDIVVSLQGGQAPLTVLLQQGGQLRDMFGGAGVAARALGSAVLGMVNPLTVSLATVAGLGYAYSQGSKEADAFRLALVSTGSASGATVGQMQQMAASIDGVVGTQAKAAETLALFATQTVAGKASMEQYATAAIAWEQASGESVESVAKKFGSLKDAPLQGVLKLNESMNFLTESVYAQIKSLEEQGKTTEAAKVAQDALANALQDRSAEMVKNLGSIERGWKNVKHAVAETWDAIKGIGRATPPEELLSASRSRVNVMQAEYDYKSQRGMSTGTLGERLEKEKGLLATLQAQVKANADSAQAEADRLTRVNARADADKNALKYLDDQAKMARQIASESETIQRAYTGKTDAASQKAMEAEIEASEANIRKSYEKTKKVRESAATSENEVASIRAKIAEQTRYLQTMQETGAEYTKLSEGERLVIKINEELQTGLKGAARANKEKALAAAEALVVVEKQVGAEQALAKSHAESEAAYRKDLSSMAQRTDAIDAQAAQLEAANAVYGKGKIAIEEYTLQLEQERLKRLNALGLQGATTEELTREIEARQRLIAAMKQAEFKAARQKSTESLEQAKAANDLVREEIGLIGMTEVERKKIIAARKAEIELAKELRAIDAMGIDEADKETLRIEARAKSRIDAETNAARAVLDDWQKTADDINRSLTDALLRGFESGKDFARNLRDTIENMFSTLVLRPVISAVMTPVSGAVNGMLGMGGAGGSGGVGGSLASLANMGSTANSVLGFVNGQGMLGGLGASIFGSTAAYAAAVPGLTSMAAGSQAAMLAAQTGVFGAAGTSATAAAGAGAAGAGGLSGAIAAIPGWGWALAGIGALFGGDIINGLFGRKLKDSGIEGTFGGASGFDGRQFEYYKGGLFRSDKTKYKDLDEETRAALADTFNAMRSGAKEMAGVLGLGTQAIDGFTAHVKVSLKGLSAEEADKRLKEEFDKVAESLASTTLGTQDYTRAGETALQTLTRLSGSLTGVNQVFENLGATLYASSLAGADMASQLVDLFGGMDGLSQTAGSYMQNYYSADEQRAAVQRQLQKAFDGLSLKLPDIDASDARAQFRSLAEAQDLSTEAGRKTYAALLQLSGAFAGITQSAEDAAAAAKQLAEEQERARQDSIRSASDLLRRAIDRDRDALQDQASGMQDVINALSASVSTLKNNARELYGQVDGTAQMLAAQGMVYIEQALGGVRAGGSIADYTGLTDAIGAARGGIATGAYASQFERERDALVLAGQLSELGDLGDLQLSIEERQLKALTAQIDTLDALAQRADDLINGTTALTGTVQSYFDQLLKLLNPEKPEETEKKTGGVFAIGGSATGGGGGDSGTPYDKDAAVRYTVGAQLQYGADKGLSHDDPAVLKAINAAVYGTGITQADIAKAYGVPEDDIARLFAGVGLPKFDVGTNRVPRTGLAVVHEGEAIIPKAYNPWAGGGQAGGNAEMLAELRALREEVAQLRAVSQATASSTAQMAEHLDQVTEGGNAMRTEVV